MHLADGNIDVQYSNLPEGQDASVGTTVQLMSEMAKGQWGARSPKIRALAINIINSAGVANKDYFGMLEAVHNYVRDQIRYVKDPVGQETLSYPEETLLNSKAGDCDDLTIAEMALLGSLGLRSYPVVIGLVPNHFSHVYLHAEIPPGKHRYAGTTIAADPIMREWPLGKAAPDDRVKAKRTYPHLAGLGTMALNGYARGPSYFSPADEIEASQVGRVLKSRYVDTGSRGTIVNTKRLTEWGDELDDMFNRAATINPMQAAPAYDLYSRGPTTNRAEKVLTSYLHEAKPVRNISAPMDQPRRQRGPNIVTIVDRKRPAKANKAPTVGELMGLSDYITDLSGPALRASQHHLVGGKTDPLHRVVAAAAYTKQRAKKASGRVVRMEQNAGFLFGLGDVTIDHKVAAAKQVEALAHQVAAKAQRLAEQCAGNSPFRQQAMRTAFGALDHMDCYLGVIDAVAEAEPADHPRIDAQEKVDTLTVISKHPTFLKASEFRAAPPAARQPKNPIAGVMPGGAVVRDQSGKVIFSDDGSDDGLAGFFSNVSQAVRRVASAPKKAVQSVHSQVKKIDTQVKQQVKKAGATVKQVAKNKRFRNLMLGVATGGASLLTKETIHRPLSKYMNRSKGGGSSPAHASASVVTPTSTTPPASTSPADQSIIPQPGESEFDPNASAGTMPGEDFGPEDMGPAMESESAMADEQAMAAGGGEGQSFTDTQDVSESGIDPFADEGESSSASGEEAGGTFMDEGGAEPAGDDATEGTNDDATYADEGEGDQSFSEEAPQPLRSRARRSSSRDAVDMDNTDLFDDADDGDMTEDGGEGEEESSAEEPPIEGLTLGGMSLGTLALAGIGLYLFTRK